MVDYEKLKIWKSSHRITLKIYNLTKDFPKSETYNLVSQMRRAAYSIPSNIVEGSHRSSKKETFRFFNISMAPASELKYFILLSKDLGYINYSDYKIFKKDLDVLIKQIYKFIHVVK